MKNFFIIIVVFCILFANVSGQERTSNLSAEEEREAKELAVTFFNRFQETQDITPLINEFFVKDFPQRLKFCRTTGECTGEGKDFWKAREDIAALNADKSEFQRIYAVTINDMFLSFQCFYFLNKNPLKNITEKDSRLIVKAIKSELELELKNNPRISKFGFFGDLYKDIPDDGFYTKFKTLMEMRQILGGYEQYLKALAKVELKLRANFKTKNSSKSVNFLPTDFRAYDKEINDVSFDYPDGTKMIEVWWDDVTKIPFIMDLIKEDGKLKIVAVYPPID